MRDCRLHHNERVTFRAPFYRLQMGRLLGLAGSAVRAQVEAVSLPHLQERQGLLGRHSGCQRDEKNKESELFVCPICRKKKEI